MTLKRNLLFVALVCVFTSLACAGTAGLPVDTPTPLPVETPTLPPYSGPTQPGGLESATVTRVIDGDTVELSGGRRVRYIGINTPEHGQPFYTEAAQANRELVAGKTVQLEFDVDTFDKYGRTLAYVWVNGTMANLEIVRQGYANTFTVPPNIRYQAEFRHAEQEAREAGRGLWGGSTVALKILNIHADAAGSDKLNPNGEWIEIANQSDSPVNMRGYTLKDEANHIYTFGDFTLPAGGAFRLYSGQGQNSHTQLYWGLENDSVWNNNADTAFLRDAEGNLVDMFAY